MTKFILIALAWLLILGGLTLLVVVLEHLHYKRKTRMYERNFAEMGLESSETGPGKAP